MSYRVIHETWVVVSQPGPGCIPMRTEDAKFDHCIILAGPFENYYDAEEEAEQLTVKQENANL